LIHRAVAGERDALGELLARHHTYLSMLAAGQLHHRMQSKADASDLVQETYLVVQSHINTFRGSTDSEFASWLRSILGRVLARHFRRYLGTQRRDVRLEESLTLSIESSSMMLQNAVIDTMSSPADQLICLETAVAIASALDAISESYRQVILLRYMQGLSLQEIAQTMNRTPDSIEKLLVRGLKKLKHLLIGRLGSSFYLSKG
jgi:RNA polymerase sigma-70 factor (ECF subfamily)